MKTATRKLVHRNCFIVEIDGFDSAKFTTATTLKKEAELVELKEGASDVSIKELGDTTYEPVTFTRGQGLDSDMWDWAVECLGSPSKPRLEPHQAKRNFDVVQYNHAGAEIGRWSCYNGIMTTFEAGQGWDKGANEALIDSMTVAHDGFEPAGG